ncbi:hypothetical protein Tco_0545527 [Tanacetum coccineum]
MARIEERLDQFVDQLADRMNNMTNPRRRGDRNGQRSEGDESEIPLFEGDGSSQPDLPRNDIQETDDQLVSRYISGLRVQIMDSVNRQDWVVEILDQFLRGLKVVEWEDDGVVDNNYEKALVFNDDQYKAEIVSGDVGVNLMITLMPNTPKELVNKPTGTLLTLSQFEDELEMGDEVHKVVHENLLLNHIQCSDVFNVKYLLPYHGDSSDHDLVGNSRMNFVYLRGNDACPIVEKWALLFLETQVRVKKMPLFKVA